MQFEYPSFLDPRPDGLPPDEAPDMLWPIPLEQTVSYAGGTGRAPAAIVRAGAELERYDDELAHAVDWDVRVLPASDGGDGPLDNRLKRLEHEAMTYYRRHAFVLALGGEHTLTVPLVRAARQVYGPLGVLHIDAHADLRPAYLGEPWSHACVMHHVRKVTDQTVSVGIRSLSAPEAQRIQREGIVVEWAHAIAAADDEAWIARVIEWLPPAVYLTVDVDGFDPGVIPGTGTPEPGGLGWWQGLALLRRVCECRRVVAADIVETVPLDTVPTSEYAAARLALKLLTYRRCRSSRSA